MSYYEKIKANVDIFLKPMWLDINSDLRLVPFSNPEKEFQSYFENSRSSEVKEHIPGAYVSTAQGARDIMSKYINAFILKQTLLYNIVFKDYSACVGHFVLDSPLSSNNIQEWSINFWINNHVENRGIMTIAIMRLLKYLKSMDIKRLYALVKFDNLASIRVLEKSGFEKIRNKDFLGYEEYVYKF